MPTAQDLIIDAMTDLNVIAPGESVDSALINKGLTALNRMIDSWALERLMIYAQVFKTFAFIPNHQPHTLGPSGNTPAPDWTFGTSGVDQRPTRVISANLQLPGSMPLSQVPLNIRDSAWWANQRVQALTGEYTTDLYYSPDMPNGSCYFWPIPTVALSVQLELSGLLTQFTLGTVFSMPQGYWDAVVSNLAVRLWPSMSEGEQLDPVIAEMAQASKAKIKSANSKAPNITTGGDGLPTGQPTRNDFNWRTGFRVGR